MAIHCTKCGLEVALDVLERREGSAELSACLGCGSKEFVAGLRNVDWAAQLSYEDRRFLKSIKVTQA